MSSEKTKQQSEVNKDKRQLELIDVDIFDLNEDGNMHNNLFIAQIAGILILSISIFSFDFPLVVISALIFTLLFFLRGVYLTFNNVESIEKKLNKLSDKKKKLINEKFDLLD